MWNGTKKEALQVLDGLMLGDGSIRRYSNAARYHMNQSKPSISIEDHLKWEYWLRDSVFAALGIKANVETYWATHSVGAKKGQRYQLASLQTVLSPILADVYDEWYAGGEWSPNGNYIRKAHLIVPPRFVSAGEIPILALAHWYLGDGGGSLYYMQHTPKVDINFSTQCLSEEDVYSLMTMLNNMGIETTKPHRMPHKSGSGLRIYLAQNSINDFMSLVEPHILEVFGDSEGMSYKDMIRYKPAAPATGLHLTSTEVT